VPDTVYALAAALTGALVTWALRGLPFTVLARLRASATIRFLSTRMPGAIMVILTIYCLRDVSLAHPRAVSPLAALAVTIGLHVWRRNAMLSIVGGTVVHVVLSSTVFAE
jgi:branched-subunit amino acid transport protein AzlD